MELTGKNVFITGSTRGLAKQLRWLCERGRQYCFKRSE